jgi:hypothetical protein
MVDLKKAWVHNGRVDVYESAYALKQNLALFQEHVMSVNKKGRSGLDQTHFFVTHGSVHVPLRPRPRVKRLGAYHVPRTPPTCHWRAI